MFGSDCINIYSEWKHSGHDLTELWWSPDGRLIAGLVDFERIELRDAQTGEELENLSVVGKMIMSICWSPDSKCIGARLNDDTFSYWTGLFDGPLTRKFISLKAAGEPLVWVRNDGLGLLAAQRKEHQIGLWDLRDGQLVWSFEGHTDWINALALSPDGLSIASASDDGTIRIWDTDSGECLQVLQGHDGDVTAVAWSPDGSTIASGGEDFTVRTWSRDSGQLLAVLEGHSVEPSHISYSGDGSILLSVAEEDSACFWRCLDGALIHRIDIPEQPETDEFDEFDDVSEVDKRYREQMDQLEEKIRLELAGKTTPRDEALVESLVEDTLRDAERDLDEEFRPQYERADWVQERLLYSSTILLNPVFPLIVISYEGASESINEGTTFLARVDVEALQASASSHDTISYSNAKVVLVGDTGVGKSGLGLVLTGQQFELTPSTHGRRVWVFDAADVPNNQGRLETREILLWDLAGQPGYRLVHQLHLSEVALALIVFDSRSDSLGGVHHWVRALRQVQALQQRKCTMFLIAARVDRGGVSLSKNRIDATVQEWGFSEFFSTSAKEGWGVKELAKAIKETIPWDALPKVSSTKLFHRIKEFLISEKETGRILAAKEDLFRTLVSLIPDQEDLDEFKAQFEVCIRLVEARGLIRRLSFGNLVLLQPEFLDAYASAIVHAAQDEPEGLGSIREDIVRECRFPMSPDERIRDIGQEQLMLIATIEDLLRHEVALREPSEDGVFLVFPAHFTREWADAPDPEGVEISIYFEGALMNIYATLVVRLANSGQFKKAEMWRNTALFRDERGGLCGLLLHRIEEGRGELVLFFGKDTQGKTKQQFEGYVSAHLKRKSVPGSWSKKRHYTCQVCYTPLTDLQVERRKARGFSFIECNVCGSEISLLDSPDEVVDATDVGDIVSEMNRTADTRRDQDAASASLAGKIATNDFDVFLAHNSKDKHAVQLISEELKHRGIYPWLDVEQVPPGQWFQDGIQRAIPKVKSVAIILGPHGIGKWEETEMRAFLSRAVKRQMPVIPVLLPGHRAFPRKLSFLAELNWVEFASLQDAKSYDRLVWGITARSMTASRGRRKKPSMDS